MGILFINRRPNKMEIQGSCKNTFARQGVRNTESDRLQNRQLWTELF